MPVLVKFSGVLKFKMIGGNNSNFSLLNFLDIIKKCKKSREVDVGRRTTTSRSTSFYYIKASSIKSDKHIFLEAPTLYSCINTMKLKSLAKPVDKVRGTCMSVRVKSQCSFSSSEIEINVKGQVETCEKTSHSLKTDECSPSAIFILSKNQNHKSRGQLNKIFRLKHKTSVKARKTEEIISPEEDTSSEYKDIESITDSLYIEDSIAYESVRESAMYFEESFDRAIRKLYTHHKF